MALLDNIGDAFGAFAGNIGGGLSSVGNIFSPYGIIPQASGGYSFRYPSDLGSSGSVMDSQEGPGGTPFIFNSSREFSGFNTYSGNPHIQFELFQPVMDSRVDTLESKYNDADLGNIKNKSNAGNQKTVVYTDPTNLNSPNSTEIVGTPILSYNSKYKIAMYMTPNISITDQMHYETGNRAAMAWLQRFGSGSTSEDAKKDIAMGMNSMGQEAMTALAAGGFLTKKLGNLTAGALTALGAPVAATGAEHMRRSGEVFNPNEYLQFKNAQLRTFSFQFKFLPNSELESRSAAGIIKAFRASMRPKKLTALTMESPYQVQTTFVNAGSMTQIASSYITSVNVTYNPNSASYFRHDGNPVEIDMSIELSEIYPLYRSDIEGNHSEKGGTFGDSFSGHPNQMGVR